MNPNYEASSLITQSKEARINHHEQKWLPTGVAELRCSLAAKYIQSVPNYA